MITHFSGDNELTTIFHYHIVPMAYDIIIFLTVKANYNNVSRFCLYVDMPVLGVSS